MKREEWHIKDFTMCFSAQAHDFLFEEMIFKDYVPGNRERLLISVDGRLSEYTLTDSLPGLHQEGDAILMKKAGEIIQALESKMLDLENTSLITPITPEALERVYAHLAEVLRLYGQIDIWYTEGLYNSDGSLKPGREEVVKIVETSKNRLRGGLIDETFFGEEGYFQRFVRALSDQFGISRKDVLQYSKQGLLSLIIDGQRLAEEEITARKKAYAFLGDGTTCTLLTGGAAEKFYEDFCQAEEGANDILTLSGSVAYRAGVVKGEAMVLVANQEISLEEAEESLQSATGKILVTTIADARMDVQYQKAKALVTEVGGLLSHAAIVAREFKIPCVVGVKNATQIIKSGDVVEVDAESGVVRILDKIEGV